MNDRVLVLPWSPQARIFGLLRAGGPLSVSLSLPLRLTLTLTLALCLSLALCGCNAESGAKSGAAGQPGTSLSPEAGAKLLLLGSGERCTDDNGCGELPLAGTCVLGTCFGLLTVDSSAARTVIVERLGAAPEAIAAQARAMLLLASEKRDANTRIQVAIVEGLAAFAPRDPARPCEDVCPVLREFSQSTDALTASTARVALARRADSSVVEGLLADLDDGTPHLRCAAARALGNYQASPSLGRVRAALKLAEKGTDGAVADAAREALVALETDS